MNGTILRSTRRCNEDKQDPLQHNILLVNHQCHGRADFACGNVEDAPYVLGHVNCGMIAKFHIMIIMMEGSDQVYHNQDIKNVLRRLRQSLLDDNKRLKFLKSPSKALMARNLSDQKIAEPVMCLRNIDNVEVDGNVTPTHTEPARQLMEGNGPLYILDEIYRSLEKYIRLFTDCGGRIKQKPSCAKLPNKIGNDIDFRGARLAILNKEESRSSCLDRERVPRFEHDADKGEADEHPSGCCYGMDGIVEGEVEKGKVDKYLSTSGFGVDATLKHNGDE
ncbi:MAG: hypothetical protein M1827_000275 [Pycnora praestabilis]|nr:MAG: hypothetical protein M1827_000275 [Pycnora praestabilis]